MLIVGDSTTADAHLRAWMRLGVPARKSKVKSISEDSSRSSIVDVCESSPKRKREAYLSALRAGLNVLTTEPVEDSLEATENIVNKFKANDSKFIILDTLRFIPVMLQASGLIQERQEVGDPRILRLESLIHDKRVGQLSLIHGLVIGIRACSILLRSKAVTKVFANRFDTDCSIFFVIIANLENECTAHIVAGNSVDGGKFQFAINGTGGMLSFEEPRNLEFSNKTRYSDSLKTSASTDVLYDTFSNLVRIKDEEMLKKQQSSVHLAYVVADAALRSSMSGKPVSISSR